MHRVLLLSEQQQQMCVLYLLESGAQEMELGTRKGGQLYWASQFSAQQLIPCFLLGNQGVLRLFSTML